MKFVWDEEAIRKLSPEQYRVTQQSATVTGRYEHRHVKGGIGHNLPQEAPREFAQAIVDVDRF